MSVCVVELAHYTIFRANKASIKHLSTWGLIVYCNKLYQRKNTFIFAFGMMCMADSILWRNTHYCIMSQQFVCTFNVSFFFFSVKCWNKRKNNWPERKERYYVKMAVDFKAQFIIFIKIATVVVILSPYWYKNIYIQPTQYWALPLNHSPLTF